ncbi:MAG: cyclase family protein [Firmicutes bacterium]|nr:cyclase family protein [Bacillota bacterium]
MNQRRIYDISIPIRESMPTWPGDPGFERSLIRSIKAGAAYEASVIRMGSHVGTHVDAPAHFVLGAGTVDKLPLDILIGEVAVFELDVKEKITRDDLEGLKLADRRRVLFKTRNSKLWESDEFTPNYVYFTVDAANYLVGRGIRLVGIDYLSVAKFENGAEVHRIFLENGVIVIESLDLSAVRPGDYEIMCLPLKILGADGAPARVVLRELQ